MSKHVIYFPIFASRAKEQRSVNREPVFIKNEGVKVNPTSGASRLRCSMQIDPWDLRRLVKEANRLGLEGKTVDGFGYGRDDRTVVIGAKPDKRA